jgi:hypothetical protein
VADSEPRPLLRVQGAKVALAKVSEASRKVRVQPHFESAISNLKMGRGKRAGHWRAVVLSQMHIDDGTGGWNGGTSLTHEDNIVWDEYKPGTNYKSFYDIKWGDGWDTNGNWELDNNEENNLNGNYFDISRWGIFHYCLMLHNLWNKKSDATWIKWTGYSNGPNNNENNHWGGDDFSVSSKADGDKQWKCFMHELGHNLGLAHPDIDGDQKTNPNCHHTGHSDLKKSIMHSKSWDGTDYFDDEWRDLKLEYVKDTHYKN